MTSVYDIIKKQNGEHFAKAIRNYNNGIFEIPDIVNIVKYSGREAEPILPYLMSLLDIQIKEAEYEDPFALLKKAGYNAYYADTLEKQNAISKYFEEDEQLCTFRDETRFERYYIINAVKENVDDIKRENFTDPSREDEYGTSVISIQIHKNGGFISIKNRYNHTVKHPDNTFSSNPDNIIYGLSYSLKKYFDVDFSSQKVELPDNYVFIKNQIFYYDYEADGYYFGDGFYMKDGEITKVNQPEVMIDNYILNLQDKKISSILPTRPNTARYGYDVSEDYNHTAELLTNELKDKPIQIVKNEDKTKSILLDGEEFIRLKGSKMIKLSLKNITKTPIKFLSYSLSLKDLDLPNVDFVGDYLLYNNKVLENINIAKAEILSECFLDKNQNLKKLDIPNVKIILNDFMRFNVYNLEYINAPMLEEIGRRFCDTNKSIRFIDFPNVKTIGHDFFKANNILESINLPEVEYIYNNFLQYNEKLEKIDFPKLFKIEDNFINNDKHNLKSVNLPSVKEIGKNFLGDQSKFKIEELNMPNIGYTGDYEFGEKIRKKNKENADKKFFNKLKIANIDR
ncbi:leucine-rich repeat protein [bacterium]|nr:leucine-rich repeat protein [bacterium]